MSNGIEVGTFREILPAFDSETHARTLWDDVAGCEGEVLEIRGNDVIMRIRGMGERWIARSRIKPRMPRLD